MEVHRHRTRVESDLDGAVEVTQRATPRGFTWRMANTSGHPVAVRSATAAFTLSGITGRLRMLCNGQQSASEVRLATLGVDPDPAVVQGAPAHLVRTLHADPEGGRTEHLRSEMGSVILDDHSVVLAGFLGGDLHDGTVVLGPGQTGQEVHLRAHFGGAVLQPGEERELHEVWIAAVDDPLAALEEWATEYGRRSLARVRSTRQVGWGTWSSHFEGVRELDVRAALEEVGDWPIELFRVDEGYQSSIGDWLDTAERFPSGLSALAGAIDRAGCRPGLWLAPFLASPLSVVAAEHPEWIVRSPDGQPVPAGWESRWGGFVHSLDTTHPAVQEHLAEVAHRLVDMGFIHLMVDHLHAAALPGVHHDRSLTPAQRVRAGLDAVRAGAGQTAFLAGGGAPLGPATGVLDSVRTGPDIGGWWVPQPGLWDVPGYEGTIAAGVNAWRNVLGRVVFHRRLWNVDPDVLLLAGAESDMSADQLRAWALAVAVTGGSLMVGDDLATLGSEDASFLADLLEISRRADEAATAGAGARCEDLFHSPLPRRLRSDGLRLAGEPERGFARVVAV